MPTTEIGVILEPTTATFGPFVKNETDLLIATIVQMFLNYEGQSFVPTVQLIQIILTVFLDLLLAYFLYISVCLNNFTDGFNPNGQRELVCVSGKR